MEDFIPHEEEDESAAEDGAADEGLDDDTATLNQVEPPGE